MINYSLLCQFWLNLLHTISNGAYFYFNTSRSELCNFGSRALSRIHSAAFFRAINPLHGYHQLHHLIPPPNTRSHADFTASPCCTSIFRDWVSGHMGVWRARLSSHFADAATSLADVAFVGRLKKNRQGRISFRTSYLNRWIIHFHRKLSNLSLLNRPFDPKLNNVDLLVLK